MGPGESRRRPERCQIAGGRPLDLELFVRRVGLQLGAVHRHRQHAVIADAGRQLDVFVRAEAVHHRFRQAVFDPVVAQQLAGEVDDLEVFRRDAVRMFVADGVDGGAGDAPLLGDHALDAPDVLRLEMPPDDECGEGPGAELEGAFPTDHGAEMGDPFGPFRRVHPDRERPVESFTGVDDLLRDLAGLAFQLVGGLIDVNAGHGGPSLCVEPTLAGMGFQEAAHTLDGAGLQFRRLGPGEDGDLGVGCQGRDVDRGLMRVGRGVVRQDQDRRFAAGDEVARDTVEEVRVHPVKIVQVLIDHLVGDVGPVRLQGRRPDFLAGAVHDVRVLRPMADRLAEDGGDDPVRRLFQQLAGEAAADAEAHIGELVDPKVVHQSQLVFGEAAPRVVDGKRASALALVGIALIHGDAAEVRLEGFERVDHGIRPIVEPGVQSAARRHEQGEAAAGLFVTDADVASFVKRHGNLLDMRQSNFLRYREDKSRTRAWSPPGSNFRGWASGPAMRRPEAPARRPARTP